MSQSSPETIVLVFFTVTVHGTLVTVNTFYDEFRHEDRKHSNGQKAILPNKPFSFFIVVLHIQFYTDLIRYINKCLIGYLKYESGQIH